MSNESDRISELESDNERLKRIEFAWNEWQDKTEWVQKTAKPSELGMHRADVLRLRIERAGSQRDKLLAELKNVVSCCETHDKAIGKILGTPPGWRDAYLDHARAAIAEVEGK